jgi:flagellar hook protein FlgE
MGMSSALFSGVSGLTTNGIAMSVIGNNLANTNTVGFKGSRTVFADLLSSAVAGSGGSSQIGRGVGMSRVDQIFSQGTFESTESNLDVAIEGDGFFILKQPGDDTEYYSRGGSFRFDQNGYLVNPEGFRVQGKGFNENGNLEIGDPTDIQIQGSGLVAGNITSTVQLTTNLNSSENIIPDTVPDPNNPAVTVPNPFDPDDDGTFNYASSVQVFDSLGNDHLIFTYFRKTADNAWDAYWSAEDSDGLPLSGQLSTNDTGGQITFTENGVLTLSTDPVDPKETTATILGTDLLWANGATSSDIEFTFDTTQFNSESIVLGQTQNGFGAGNLTEVAINAEGIAIASYSNGVQTKIGQLVLGKFTNPGGLSLAGSNLYAATDQSGTPRVGLPGPELGNIFTNSLEQSNVDMGAEFVTMITIQRGFQANSKIITTVDELLGELINLKR